LINLSTYLHKNCFLFLSWLLSWEVEESAWVLGSLVCSYTFMMPNPIWLTFPAIIGVCFNLFKHAGTSWPISFKPSRCPSPVYRVPGAALFFLINDPSHYVLTSARVLPFPRVFWFSIFGSHFWNWICLAVRGTTCFLVFLKNVWTAGS